MVKVPAEWWSPFLQEEFKMVRGAWSVQMVEDHGIISCFEQCGAANWPTVQRRGNIFSYVVTHILVGNNTHAWFIALQIALHWLAPLFGVGL